ncbi:LysM peptidoglycan-binding domain-containing protein [Roseovarius sp. M141]|uniref:LysM peptidoglycan-binding domain-containing protein n=1 Tax=Roseovarius sp. M141 TaxID=2583806 RepID=UPI0020CE22C8|nr:LysM peptidoglycan-binding domain-containing protein [Roseovarius sp. M141]MCQ0093362.1 LysM peptidoglycan-binding domain-containing protein [Roseovarius sp. M141]
MSKLSGLRGAGAIVAGVAVLGLVVLYLAGLTRPAPERAGDPPASAAVQTDDSAAPQSADAGPGQDSPLSVQSAVAPPAPQIDIFRLQPDGEALIAGRGVPGWSVQILLDGAVQTAAEPGDDGRFAVFLSLPQAPDPRLLSLRMIHADGGAQIAGVQQIVVAAAPVITADLPERPAPPDTAKGAPPDAGPSDTDAQQTPQGVTDTGTSKTLAPADAAGPAQVVMMADAGGARILQSASAAAAPRVQSNVALDTISYTDDGDVQLAGRAVGQGIVRIYLDNRPIATSRIAADGTWRTGLPQVDTGIYALRIDEVTSSGTVASRVETPFKREDRALLAELQDTDARLQGISTANPQTDSQPGTAPAIRVVTVQPGNTLWAISRETYGEGTLYVRVFEANAERIGNPDLIYPGQVFTLPD